MIDISSANEAITVAERQRQREKERDVEGHTDIQRGRETVREIGTTQSRTRNH